MCQELGVGWGKAASPRERSGKKTGLLMGGQHKDPFRASLCLGPALEASCSLFHGCLVGMDQSLGRYRDRGSQSLGAFPGVCAAHPSALLPLSPLSFPPQLLQFRFLPRFFSVRVTRRPAESQLSLALAALSWVPGLHLSFFSCKMGLAILSVLQYCKDEMR